MSPMVADYIAPLVIVDTILKFFKNGRNLEFQPKKLKRIQCVPGDKCGGCLWHARCP